MKRLLLAVLVLAALAAPAGAQTLDAAMWMYPSYHVDLGDTTYSINVDVRGQVDGDSIEAMIASIEYDADALVYTGVDYHSGCDFHLENTDPSWLPNCGNMGAGDIQGLTLLATWSFNYVPASGTPILATIHFDCPTIPDSSCVFAEPIRFHCGTLDNSHPTNSLTTSSDGAIHCTDSSCANEGHGLAVADACADGWWTSGACGYPAPSCPEGGTYSECGKCPPQISPPEKMEGEGWGRIKALYR